MDNILPLKLKIGQLVPILNITILNWFKYTMGIGHVMHIVFCMIEITHFGGRLLKIASLLYLYNLPKYLIKQLLIVLFGSLTLSFIFFL